MYRQYVQSGIAPGANTVTTSAIAANTIQPWQLSSSLLNPTVNSFTGDGTTTSFTLSLPPASANTVVVTVNGITQSPVTNYSTNNTSLVFTSAPSNASVIRAVQQAMIGTSIVPIDGSVTTSKLGSSLTLSGNTSFSGAISGTSATLSSTLGVTGVTTLTAQPILSSLTASSAVATDASKGLVSVTNTGSGNNVLSASPTLTGTVAAASLSLSSLTSGRITYANTSGLLTDSANLNFTGTRLGIGTSNPSELLHLQVSSGDVYLQLQSVANQVYVGFETARTVGVIQSTNALTFDIGSSYTERMRITSAGNVGIGTTTPDVFNRGYTGTTVGISSTSGETALMINSSGTNVVAFEMGRGGSRSTLLYDTTTATEFGTLTSKPLKLLTNGAVVATLDSSGNLGLGVTPSAWTSGFKAIQMGDNGSFYADGGGTYWNNNWYINTSLQAKYLTTNTAQSYEQANGKHAWYIAPSGSAGANVSFTQAMTLDTSGNLLVGTTTALSRLTTSRSAGAAGAVNGQIAMTHDTATTAYYISTIRADATNEPAGLTFKENATERMRIDASGNVGIGTSTPANKLDVYTNSAATYAARIFNNNAYGGLFLQTSSVSSSTYNLACYNSASYLFVVRDDGNVGIGTSSPSSKLDVESSAAQTLVRIISTDTGGRIWNIGSLATASGLGTGGSFVFRDSTQGNTQLQVGQYNQTVSLQGASPVSGTGITFPASQSASSNANTLDDYEEGTWTPTLASNGGGETVTYNYRSGVYRKIGSMVYVQFGMNIASTSGGSAGAYISGLPFVAIGRGAYQEPAGQTSGGNWVSAAYAGQTAVFVTDNSTLFGMRYLNNADTDLPFSQFQGGSAGSATYISCVMVYCSTN